MSRLTEENALSPTIGGIIACTVIWVRPEQLTKAQPSIVVTPSGIVMEVRLLQLTKAQVPILVTFSGRMMEVRRLQ